MSDDQVEVWKRTLCGEEIAALRAERDRMREALGRIAAVRGRCPVQWAREVAEWGLGMRRLLPWEESDAGE